MGTNVIFFAVGIFFGFVITKLFTKKEIQSNASNGSEVRNSSKDLKKQV